MLELRELIERELQNIDTATVGEERLYKALGPNAKCIGLARGIFSPDIAVIGDWTPEEILGVRGIIRAREQANSQTHEFARGVTGENDPFVERHKKAYECVYGMKVGDVSRTHVDSTQYLIAALPSQEQLSTYLALFVK